MIEKMKTVCVVASEAGKNALLKQIRDLGVLHIKSKKDASAECLAEFDTLSKTLLSLSEIPGSEETGKILSDAEFDSLNNQVLQAFEDKKTYQDLKTKTSMEADKIRPWGYFEPDEITSLGYTVFFYRMGKRDLAKLAEDKDIKFIHLSSVEKMETVAVLGSKLPPSFSATEFKVPERGLRELEEIIADCDEKLDFAEAVIKKASKEISSYKARIHKCKNDVSFSSASRSSESSDGLVWLSGYIPESESEAFCAAAKKNNWAYAIDDVADDDEEVPTKVKYTKVTGLMKPVFDILGTVPGYHEYDISFWFLCFFALFFAMIIGDAGYGLCFLAVAVALNIKQKKTTNLTMLIYVVSAATIVWGAVTGTWFGLEGAMNIGLLKALVLPPIANYPEYFGVSAVSQQNSMMKFCFMLGTLQLTLACVMNIRTKIKAKCLGWLADVGWLLSINSLYYVVLLLVIGADVNLKIPACIIVLGFLLVVFFAGMSPDKSFKEGLKASVADAFTDFLNTISAFGNIMSYIRLFAVGLASLAIAQSFNDMALGMTGFMKVFGIIIFIIGHALNLVMGLLSVIVHGIRLNLLEFSGQLGMEWSGTAYEPFKEIEK